MIFPGAAFARCVTRHNVQAWSLPEFLLTPAPARRIAPAGDDEADQR